ncbi:MAG: tetratricopeptide repeat protein [Pseudohongiellaceae bacterium]
MAKTRKQDGSSVAAEHLAYGLPLITLLLMVAVSYWPSYFAGFVWDDKVFFEAPPISEWGGLLDLWLRPASLEYEGHYWPLVYTTFWLEHKLWGFNPVAFHLVNVVLHAGISVLLWRLLMRLEVPAAWFIAAIFAVHPVHVEAVAWVIARKDLFATLLYLLAVFCWLRFGEQPKGRQGRRLRAVLYSSVLLLYGAAMLSKTVAITLPVALLILAWWKYGRITWQDMLYMLPLFVIGFIIAVLDFNYYSGRAAFVELNLGLGERLVIVGERLITVGKALWFYCGKLLWPQPLSIIYPKWDVNPGNLLNWLPLLAAMLLALTLWLARHRIGRGPLAGALFFAVTLSPMLGLAENVYTEFSFVADRYQYLSGVGLIAVLVAAAVTAWRRITFPDTQHGEMNQAGAGEQATTAQGTALLSRWFAGHSPVSGQATTTQGTVLLRAGNYGIKAVATLLLLGCMLLTFNQTKIYKDEITFFTHITTNNPAAHHAHFNLGNALREQGRMEEAITKYQIATEQDPESTEILINIGVAWLESENYQAAEEAFRRAVTLEPGEFQAQQNLAAALRRQQRFSESLAVMQTAATLMPEPIAQHYFYMARDAVALEQAEEAVQYFRQALAIDPNYQAAREELTFLYLNEGRYTEALEAIPNILQMLDQLAYGHYNAGRVEQALELYQHSVAIDPNDANAHANLGSTLAQLGRFTESLTHLEQALTLNPQHETARTSLQLVRSRLNNTESAPVTDGTTQQPQ